MRFETKVLHNGNHPVTGVSRISMNQASTYHPWELGQLSEYHYTQTGNPTRQALEETIARLEIGVRGFAFDSGMAAISTVLLLFSRGDHLIISQDVYGGAYHVITQVFKRMGIETTFVDTSDLCQVHQAIRPHTKAIYLETPSNPLLRVTDIKGVAGIARANRLLTIVDNTSLTPYYQRPLLLDADIVIHSTTKLISGHSAVMGGLVATNDEGIARQIAMLQNAFGAILGVQDCWIVLRGLKTLQARMERSTQNAEIIACWLQQHPRVKKVYYTGLPTHEGYHLQSIQSSGHGGILSFDIGDEEQVKRILNRVRLPVIASHLGAVGSTLSYPAQMSHGSMPASVREKYGVKEGLLRLSVGLEHVDDLIADLKQAMGKPVRSMIGK